MVGAKNKAYGAIIALLAALAVYTYAMRYGRAAAPPAPDLARIPRAIAGYEADDEALAEAVIDVLRADATLARTYRAVGLPRMWLFIGYFAASQEGSQIHSPKHCFPGGGWNILSEETVSIAAGGGVRPAKTLVISNGAERHFVLYWFLAADGVLADEFALKWSQMKNSLLGRSRATAFVRFSTPIGMNEDAEEAGRACMRFAEAIAPYIDDALPSGAVGEGPRGIGAAAEE